MKVGIIGAGVAGLFCAKLLQKEGFDVVVFENRNYVGGIARSFEWNGFSCDFAAHRLFTKDKALLQQLLEVTPMLEHDRRSQIYFNGQWMQDPLDVIELAKSTDIRKLIKLLGSYLFRPRSIKPDSFRSFVERHYGRQLYNYFFRPYTEKLFGIPGSSIALSWAKSKVRLAGPLDRFRESSKTKFNHFYYPERGGYGEIAATIYREIQSTVQLNSKVTGLEAQENKVTRINYIQNGNQQEMEVDLAISTLPLTLTSKMVGYPLELDYRAVHAVYLLINKPRLTNNHWIYFIDDSVVVNRLVEFKNMSPIGTPATTTVICAEVTCVDSDIVKQTIQSLVETQLFKAEDVIDSAIITEPFAYPIYIQDYEARIAGAQSHLSRFHNLFTIGRAAEFKHREIDDNFSAAQQLIADILSQYQNQCNLPCWAAKTDMSDNPATADEKSSKQSTLMDKIPAGSFR